MQKHVSYEKWFKYYIFFAYRFTQKFFNALQKFFKSTKSTYFLRYTIDCFIYRITQKFSDTLWTMPWNGWKCIFDCVTWFLTLFNKVEKYLCIRFVRLFVRSCVYTSTFVNILQMSLHLCMLFISDIELRVLKMICVGLSVRLQRHSKVFLYISIYRRGGVKVFKVYCNIFILY